MVVESGLGGRFPLHHTELNRGHPKRVEAPGDSRRRESFYKSD